MNNTNQNHTDNLFKQGLSSPPEFVPADKNWQEMERLLKPQPKKRLTTWMYPAAGIAAALLIFLSLWLFRADQAPDSQSSKNVKQPEKGRGNADIKQAPDVNTTDMPGIDNSTASNVPFERRSAVDQNKTTFPKNSSASSGFEASIPFTAGRSSLDAARYSGIKSNAPEQFPGMNIRPVIPDLSAKSPKPDSDAVETTDPSQSQLPGKWALSLAVSPDLNTVKGVESSDFGLSMGMGISYSLSKVLSVGTGVYYSEKLYSADKTSYKVSEKPFATWTSYSKEIDADCRVIDIPLNLNVRLANKKGNKLYASAGLSSYIMLSEKYAFVYNPSPAYPTGRREYSVHNENRHYLSVVNLGIAMERPLSKQVSLVVQPYAKMPLTGIGKGETDLKSFGVGFKLNYSLKKKQAFNGARSVPAPMADPNR